MTTTTARRIAATRTLRRVKVKPTSGPARPKPVPAAPARPRVRPAIRSNNSGGSHDTR